MKRCKVFALRGRQSVSTEGRIGNNPSRSQTMTKILILTVVAALVFTGYDCGNSASLDDSYDDGIGWIDRTPLEATQEVDGITFKYSLLNGKGEPANRFKRGENFSFHFSLFTLR